MVIGRQLYKLRREKNLTQGDIEARTGLLRCYISRVENGHTIPSLDTLERLAGALEVPLFKLFYDGGELPNLPHLAPRLTANELLHDEKSNRDAHFFDRLRRLVASLNESDQRLFLHFARKLASQSQRGDSRDMTDGVTANSVRPIRGRKLEDEPRTAA